MRTVNKTLTLENLVMGQALGSGVEVGFKGYQEMDSRETDSEETDSEETGSRVTDFQETGFQEIPTTTQTPVSGIPTKSLRIQSSHHSRIMETSKATQTTQKFRVTVGSKTTKH